MPTGVRYPELQDPDWLSQKYYGGPLSPAEIAESLGCSRSAVQYALKKHGMPFRRRSRPTTAGHADRQCVRCSEVFQPTSGLQLYCSKGCKNAGPPIGGRQRLGQYPQLQDAAWLRAQYEMPRSGQAIADEVGCSSQMVFFMLAKHGIPRRSNLTRAQAFTAKACRRCGTSFQPTATCNLYCSERCKKQKPYVCVECGETFWSRVSGLRKVEMYWGSPICSPACRAESRRKFLTHRQSAHLQNSDLAGTERVAAEAAIRRIDTQGYARVMVPPDYPGAYKHGWMPEHRYVMEQSIGRHLYPDETVHHINGDRADNRVENLQLRRGRHGNGVVYRCNSCGSHDVAAAEIADPT